MRKIKNMVESLKNQGKNLLLTRNITLLGLFIAMYIVLYHFNIRFTSFVEIRLGYFVIATAAMYGGPLFGLTVGVASDILSMIITGGNGASFFFGFTVSYALMGLCFGLIFHGGKVTIVKAIQGAIVEFAISIFLNTLWLSILYGNPYKASFIARLPKSLIMLGVSTVLFYVCLASLQQVLNRAHLSFENN